MSVGRLDCKYSGTLIFVPTRTDPRSRADAATAAGPTTGGDRPHEDSDPTDVRGPSAAIIGRPGRRRLWGRPRRRRRPSITLYNGQHVQTTEALVAAFEKQTGIHVNVRSDDEDVFANQIVQEGPTGPRPTSSTRRTLRPSEFLQERGLLAPVDACTFAKVATRYRLAARRVGRRDGPGSVMVYNTDLVKPTSFPRSVMELAEPRWRGKLALAAGRDRLPTHRHVRREELRQAGRPGLARGGQEPTPPATLYPDNEILTDMVNKGQAAIGIINHYYWYREKYQVGAADMHSAIAYFAPGDPGYVLDVSGAAVLKSSQHQQRGAAFPGVPREQAGPGDHRPQPELRVPVGVGGDDGQGSASLRHAAAGTSQHGRAR